MDDVYFTFLGDVRLSGYVHFISILDCEIRGGGGGGLFVCFMRGSG